MSCLLPGLSAYANEADQQEPGQESGSEGLPSENREEISLTVSENTETARSLKKLLLGRKYLFFGRVDGEAALYSDEAFDGENGAQIRALRLGAAGVLSDHLSYKAEVDLTDKTATVTDVYLKYSSSRFGSLTVGNQKVTQNLAAMTGALSRLFMEHALPVTTFSLARRLGISHDYDGSRWGAHAMIFTRDPNNDAGKRGWGIRAGFNPLRKDGGVAHLGISAVREKMDQEARYRTRPESNVTDVRLVDTGLYHGVEYQNIFGIEAAGATRAFSGRIELFRSDWERAGSIRNTFHGAYLEMGYFLTGQTFSYRGGKFIRPDFEGGKAWEIGFRASWVDLNDGDIQGGEQLNLGLALNRYLLQNLRIQTNLLYAKTDEVAGDVHSWIFQGRVQFNW